MWAAGLFLLTWWIIMFEGATHELIFFSRLYRGYDISPAGSIIGLLWAFADAFIGGLIFAWLYNFLTAKLSGTQNI